MRPLLPRLAGLARSLGPAVPAFSAKEALRSGGGAMLALALLGLLLPPGGVVASGLFLVAPFGASAVLLFAVPNSPLAQPFAVVVGNTLAALVGVAACLWVPDPVLRVALAVGGAIMLTGLARAVHPPAGAVAMTAALSPGVVTALGPWFALMPVALGSLLLVLAAAAWARLTGRRYPQRSAAPAPAPLPAAPGPRLDEAALSGLLSRYSQSLNLGVDDLARLINAAEIEVAGQRMGPLTAGAVMSRNLVSVDPDTPLAEVADLFRRHGFTSLPVVQGGDRFLGLIFQINLIRRGREDALRLERGFGPAMARLLDGSRNQPVRAGEIMASGLPRATPDTPAAALLPMLADGGCDAVPVLVRGRIVGIVTRTDLIAALAREGLRGPVAG